MRSDDIESRFVLGPQASSPARLPTMLSLGKPGRRGHLWSQDQRVCSQDLLASSRERPRTDAIQELASFVETPFESDPYSKLVNYERRAGALDRQQNK